MPANRIAILAFSPKATNVLSMAGLLTYSLFTGLPARFADSDLKIDKKLTELTASGNAQDLHLIPF